MKHSTRLLLLVVCGAALAVTAVPAFSQTISFTSLDTEVGAGLQSTSVIARLSTGAHGGITVRIETADTMLLLITDDENDVGGEFEDIFVPNGETDAQFYMQALEDTTGTVNIIASATGFTDGVQAVDVIVPGVRIASLSPSHDPFDPVDEFYVQVGVPNPSNSTVSAQKVRIGGPGLTATLSNSNASAAELITTSLTGQLVSVVVAPGSSISPSQIASGGVGFDGLAAGVTEIDASIPGFNPVTSIPLEVTVTEPLVYFTNLPDEVGSGLQTQGRIARLTGTQHGGVTMHIEVSDSTMILVAEHPDSAGYASVDIPIANGQTDASFVVQALEGVTGSFGVSASAPGFTSAAGGVTVSPPYFRISSLGGSIDTLDPNDPFWITVGLPNGSFTVISPSQSTRAGGPGVTATVTSSDGAVGLIQQTASLDDTAVVYIAPGENTSPTTVGAGGMEFDGVGVGATLVTATVPGFTPVSAGSVTVAVSQPAATLTNFDATVGAGLRTGSSTVYLGASQHGGVTVMIESLDSTLALVSLDGDTPGTPSVEKFVSNGTTSVTFWIHGLEDTTGTAPIAAAATGFLPDTNYTDVVRPAIGLVGLPSSLDTFDPPDAFYVRIGYPNAGFTNVTGQEVRPGSSGFEIDVALDDPVIGRLETQIDTSDTVTVTIAAGAANSPTSYAAGGVQLNGLNPGIVTITCDSPRTDEVTTATDMVTITSPTLAIVTTAKVGAGLQSDQGSVNLSASNHGGVTLHVESANPDILLVSDGAANPGQTYVDIFVSNGSSSVPLWVHGIDDTTGTVHLTATATGFIPDLDSAEVVVPGVEFVGLLTSIDVADPADNFYARVGVPSSDNSTVSSATQARRAGEPPLEVTFVSSDGGVAELVTLSENDDTIKVDIAAGSKTTPTTVAAGGVGLDGLSAGQTLVTGAIPGFITTGDAQVTVDVSNFNIVLNGLATRLGAGLQSEAVTAQLGEGGHGGLTVHIEVTDSLSALVSTNALVAGGASLDVPLVNGETEANFYLQALESSAGNTVTVTASAPTFSNGTQMVDLVAAGVSIVSLADTIDHAAPDDDFYVQVGAVNVDSTDIAEAQSIRGGSGSRTLTIESASQLIGRLVTSTTAGATATLTLDPGERETPATVALGGVAFSPILPGEVVVTASTPGFVTTDAGMPTVVVTGPPTGIGDPVPERFALEQNIPNPFNPTTTIRFSLDAARPVKLAVYDVRGARVATLVDGRRAAGPHLVEWYGVDDRGAPVSSGVYFYRIVSGPHVQTRKMVLLR